MIKITLQEVLDAKPGLEVISRSAVNGINAFKIGRIIRDINKEIEVFDEERKKYIEKYAMRDEKNGIVTENGMIKIKEENIPLYNQALQKMLETEIEINTEKMSIDDLANVSITPQQAMGMEKFFE